MSTSITVKLVAGFSTSTSHVAPSVVDVLLARKDELLAAMRTEEQRQGYPFFALMVTDILSKGTDLLVSGNQSAVERALGQTATDGVIELPGVISRKKQLAPQLLAAG